MTTTLRPTEPLQQEADGTRSRRFQVCVNSRPVGAVRLGTSPVFGDTVARVLDLRIDEADRRRGRATVAALAAEEVARIWGCRRIEATVPAEAEAGLRLAAALGYTERNRNLEKRLAVPPASGAAPVELPAGSRVRSMTPEEFEAWRATEAEQYARDWIARGVPEAEALARSRADQRRLLPDGLATAGMEFRVLEFQGERAGLLWLRLGAGETEPAYVYQVMTEEAVRGRGFGRLLMRLAEERAGAAGHSAVCLNVFAGNVPAERLYASLGYRPTHHHLYKPLL
ncbi:GNAT family N-acetyltransferase [Streptomyces fragilis]|uniref:GNAT family N-acetyltransferase n=1 Tax=Streptomyces fragilis TaxID=67301 RepID=A0ABV2YE35_9ACTN|nr:GNAT family N-acetyltransferase [Streptomyces fragilis]